MMELRQARFALRSLRGSRAFTITAIATLGLAIGAAATVWSVVQALLLEPLPYRDAEHLVYISSELPRAGYRQRIQGFGGSITWSPPWS